jgi:hypothetical protein
MLAIGPWNFCQFERLLTITIMSFTNIVPVYDLPAITAVRAHWKHPHNPGYYLLVCMCLYY